MAKPNFKIKNTITKKEWNKTHKDYKTIIDGIHYVMKLTDEGTALVPVNITESVDEASRGDIHKAAKKGSYPITIVISAKGSKGVGAVRHQQLVNTPMEVPAVLNVLKKKYSTSGHHFSIEDKTGKVLYNEASIQLRQVGRDTGVKLNIKAIKKAIERAGYKVSYQKGSSILNAKGIDVFVPKVRGTLTITQNGELFGDGNWGTEVSSDKEAVVALKKFEKQMSESVEGSINEVGLNVWYFYKKANKDKNKFFKMLSDFRKKHSDTAWIKMLNYALEDFNENPKKYKTIDDKQNILFKNLQNNKKVKGIDESVNEVGVFKKLWNKLFGLKKGDVVVRDAIGRGSDTLYLLLEPIDGNKEKVEVFEIGSFAKNINNEKYCSLVYNTKTAQPTSIIANSPSYKSYRPLTSEEKKLYKEALKSGEFKRYTDVTKAKTGIQLKESVNEGIPGMSKQELDRAARGMFGKSYSRLTMDQEAKLKFYLNQSKKESVDEELRPDEVKFIIGKLGDSMPNHTNYDFDKGPTEAQVLKALKKYHKDFFRHSTTKQKKEIVRGIQKYLTESVEMDEIDEKKNPGLWANIRAKRARGEKPAHGNSQAHKDAVKAAKKINKDEALSDFEKNDADYDKLYKGYKYSKKKKNEADITEGTEPEIITQLRDVVKNGYQTLKDPKTGKRMKVDSYSASAITQVYDVLSSSNQDKFIKHGLLGMQRLAFKLIK